jgi:hypothetical protein
MKHTPPTSPPSRPIIRWVNLMAVFAMITAIFMGGASCIQTITTPAFTRSGPTTLPATAPSTQVLAQDPIVISMDTQEQDQAGFQDWLRGIKARWPDGCIVVMGHGGEAFGEWSIFPTPGFDPTDMPFAGLPISEEWFVKCIRHDYGFDVPVVILSCDPGHQVITDVPNVWQATDSIWIVPDADTDPVSRYVRHLMDPGCVGNLDDFHCHFAGYK